MERMSIRHVGWLSNGTHCVMSWKQDWETLIASTLWLSSSNPGRGIHMSTILSFPHDGTMTAAGNVTKRGECTVFQFGQSGNLLTDLRLSRSGIISFIALGQPGWGENTWNIAVILFFLLLFGNFRFRLVSISSRNLVATCMAPRTGTWMTQGVQRPCSIH